MPFVPAAVFDELKRVAVVRRLFVTDVIEPLSVIAIACGGKTLKHACHNGAVAMAQPFAEPKR